MIRCRVAPTEWHPRLAWVGSVLRARGDARRRDRLAPPPLAAVAAPGLSAAAEQVPWKHRCRHRRDRKPGELPVKHPLPMALHIALRIALLMGACRWCDSACRWCDSACRWRGRRGRRGVRGVPSVHRSRGGGGGPASAGPGWSQLPQHRSGALVRGAQLGVGMVHRLEQLRRRERPAQLLLEPEAGGLVPSVGLRASSVDAVQISGNADLSVRPSAGARTMDLPRQAVNLRWLHLLGACASIRPLSERAAASLASSRLSASTSLVPWPRRHTPSRCCTASTSTVRTKSPPICDSRKVAPPKTRLLLVVLSLTQLAISAWVPAAAPSAPLAATAAPSRSNSVRLFREKSRWCRCASRLMAVEHALRQRRLRPGLTAAPQQPPVAP